MEKWYEDLVSLDAMENHQQNLNLVLEAFLTSSYADNQKKRTQVIVLFKHLDALDSL